MDFTRREPYTMDAKVQSVWKAAYHYLNYHRDDLRKRDTLREETIQMVRSGELLVGIWKAYALEVLERGSVRRTKRGPSRSAYFFRNLRIVEAIELVKASGFDPTRNPSTQTECACSIVKIALKECGVNMSEDAIVEIWKTSPFNPANNMSEDEIVEIWGTNDIWGTSPLNPADNPSSEK